MRLQLLECVEVDSQEQAVQDEALTCRRKHSN